MQLSFKIHKLYGKKLTTETFLINVIHLQIERHLCLTALLASGVYFSLVIGSVLSFKPIMDQRRQARVRHVLHGDYTDLTRRQLLFVHRKLYWVELLMEILFFLRIFDCFFFLVHLHVGPHKGFWFYFSITENIFKKYRRTRPYRSSDIGALWRSCLCCLNFCTHANLALAYC